MNRTLSTTRGTAMLVGGILGPGVLVLPRLASEAAGPAAIIAWAGLLALSVPIALTFAALGRRHPDGGGVAHFARLAFGDRAATMTGLWFYCAVPVGTVAGATVGGRYAAALFHGGRGFADLATCALLAAAVAANAIGLHASGQMQTLLVLTLAAFLAIAIAFAAPHVQAHAYTPFAPHGFAGITKAVGVLVFAFVGWEAVSHLSAEFSDAGEPGEVGEPEPPDEPSKSGQPDQSGQSGDKLRRATWWTLAIVGVLYLGLAIVSAGTDASHSPVPLQALLASGIGGLATPLTGTVAIVLTFGAINTYIAGASRLGASLARERVLPSWFADPADREPRRSLGLLAAISTVIVVITLTWSLDIDVLIRATSACLAAVNILGMAAATRLLPRGTSRRLAVVGTALALAVSACCGAYLVIPAALAVAGVLLRAPYATGRAQTGSRSARRLRSGAGTVIGEGASTAKIWS